MVCDYSIKFDYARKKHTKKEKFSHPQGTQGVSEQAVQIIIMVVVGQETQELHQELHLF